MMECEGKSILIVDDEQAIRESIADYLEDLGSRPLLAAGGKEALEVIKNMPPDAVIVDLNMPEVDGFAVIEYLVKQHFEIPIIVLSGVGVLDKAMEAMRQGAWDFLSKPIASFSVLHLTLNRVIERAKLLKENRIYRENLEEEVKKKTAQVLEMNHSLIITQKEIILKLSDVVETRSHETAYHVQRVSECSYLLGKLAKMHEVAVNDIRLAASMHDVGKIGIADNILNKPGKLSADEFNVMKNHTLIGFSIFSNSPLPVLKLAAEIALSHHERWDGEGYPHGKKGQAIPLAARITSLVDVFDAVSHPRIYKPAWDLESSFKHIEVNSGTFFDPLLVELFIDHRDDFIDIFERYP